ncbi:MAG: copper chaperone [Pseudanabaenaceae cyanobacterium]
MEISVPTIACQGCIDTLTKAIQTADPSAIVIGDVPNKKITVTSSKSLEELKVIITSTGHQAV